MGVAERCPRPLRPLRGVRRCASGVRFGAPSAEPSGKFPFIGHSVAALTARVTTEYGGAARALTFASLALATIATLWVAADVLRPVDRRGRLEQLRALPRSPAAAAGVAAAAEAETAGHDGRRRRGSEGRGRLNRS
jgi:ribosomal protein L28